MFQAKPDDWGYIRVSTAQQDYETQRQQLLAFGVRPERIVADKASGAKLEGRSLVRLIERMAPGQRIVATKLDRVARNARDVHNIVHEIAAANGSIIFLDMPALDMSDQLVRTVMLNGLAMVAELERYFIIARTSQGRQAARENGVKFGRPNKLTAWQMIEAQRRRQAGESLTSIARSFNCSHSTISRLK